MEVVPGAGVGCEMAMAASKACGSSAVLVLGEFEDTTTLGTIKGPLSGW
jgi:hypothetical protein